MPSATTVTQRFSLVIIVIQNSPFRKEEKAAPPTLQEEWVSATKIIYEAVVRIRDALQLSLNIQAVKLIEDPSDLPESALIAAERFGHLSLCQTFALMKRQSLTLYTDKKSEWCWAPVVALGYADCSPGSESCEIIKPLMGVPDSEKAERFFSEFSKLPLGKYSGVLLVPADKADSRLTCFS